MRIIFIIEMIFAVAIFFLCFFVLAPFVCSLIPQGDYKKIFDFLVYVLIAYAGGIVVPLVLFIHGIVLLVMTWE